MSAARKPLFFVGSSQRDLQKMPEGVKDVFGSALLDAQYGDKPNGARPFGEGLPGQIMKLVEDHDGETYRTAYTVALEGAVYVLDVFQKKSKSGVRTPQHVKDRVRARYKAARQDHERRYGGGGALAKIRGFRRAAGTSSRISVHEMPRNGWRRPSSLERSGRRSVDVG